MVLINQLQLNKSINSAIWTQLCQHVFDAQVIVYVCTNFHWASEDVWIKTSCFSGFKFKKPRPIKNIDIYTLKIFDRQYFCLILLQNYYIGLFPWIIYSSVLISSYSFLNYYFFIILPCSIFPQVFFLKNIYLDIYALLNKYKRLTLWVFMEVILCLFASILTPDSYPKYIFIYLLFGYL